MFPTFELLNYWFMIHFEWVIYKSILARSVQCKIGILPKSAKSLFKNRDGWSIEKRMITILNFRIADQNFDRDQISTKYRLNLRKLSYNNLESC